MSKKNFKREKRLKKLYNKVYAYNSKIDRLQNDEYISNYLPNKINYQDVKNLDGRTQNAIINNLSKFTKRGGEQLTETKQGDVVTRYEGEMIQKHKPLYNSINTYNKNITGDTTKSNVNFLDSLLKSKKERRADIKSYSNYVDNNTIIKSDRGAEITKSEMEELKRKLNIINARRKERREWVSDLPLYNNKEVIGKVGDKSLIYENDKLTALRDKKFNFKNMSKLDLEFFKKSVEKQSSDDYWKNHDDLWIENLLNGILNSLGVSPLTEKLIQTVITKYETMPKKVIEFMYSQKDFGTISYYYHIEDGQAQAEQMLEAWERI